MSVTEQTLERIRAQLREAHDIGGNVPQDLYTHLTEVFNRILMHHSDDAYDKFEEISALVKQTDLKFKDPKYDNEVNQVFGEQAVSERQRWVQRSKNLLNEVNDLVCADDRGLLTKDKKFVIPNFSEEAEMLEWAGVSFGEENTFKLGKSIKRLAIMSGADSLRFVGKIYGTQKDYWLVAGVLSQAEEAPASKTVEKRGEGVNKQVYWVTDNLLNDWIQLPDCSPEWIVQARQIKHIFTGDLNATVDSNPQFDGKERHLLRATLARIFAATAIVPKELFVLDDETGEMKFNEEYQPQDTEALKDLKNWGNLQQPILKNGRTTFLMPDAKPEDPEFDPEAALADLKAAEPESEMERFRDLEQHQTYPNPVPDKDPQQSWISKVVGDTQLYNQAPPKEGTVSYAVNVIKSLRWPGAMTVAKGGKFTTIYVGYGLKKDNPSYNPTEPPIVQDDPEEEEEKPEPNPSTQPPEQNEVDTDGENKEEGDD